MKEPITSRRNLIYTRLHLTQTHAKTPRLTEKVKEEEAKERKEAAVEVFRRYVNSDVFWRNVRLHHALRVSHGVTNPYRVC